MDDLQFAAVFNSNILADLQGQFGPFDIHRVEFVIPAEEIMAEMVQKWREKKQRRAEVVMVVPNLAGQIWLHTKSAYPENVYRLMTGGINEGEPPADALQRETEEETGFRVDIERCLGVIVTHFVAGNDSLDFASYLFLTTPGPGDPCPIDPDESISGFRAVPAAELAQVAQQLRHITGPFANWGKFRATAHTVAAAVLSK